MNDNHDIQQAVGRLSGETAKSCLKMALHHIRLLKDQCVSVDEAVAGLIELHDRIISGQMAGVEDHKRFWEPGPGATHVHIVTGDSFAGSMTLALRELGWKNSHKLVRLGEPYAIGPLGGLDTPEGRKQRADWFRNNISEAFEAYEVFQEEYAAMLDQLDRIPEHAEVIIWVSRSVTEQVGLRHATHLLRNRPNPIRVHNACTISEWLHNRPDASILYRRSGEIPPEKLKAVLKHVFAGSNGPGHLSAEEVARLSAEWLSISDQGGVLRIWQDGVVREVPTDYFDSYLLEKLDQIRPPAGDDGFVKCARLIGEAIGYCEQDIDYSFFEYRVRELVYQGILEIRGVPAAMRYYSVRRKRQ